MHTLFEYLPLILIIGGVFIALNKDIRDKIFGFIKSKKDDVVDLVDGEEDDDEAWSIALMHSFRMVRDHVYAVGNTEEKENFDSIRHLILADPEVE